MMRELQMNFKNKGPKLKLRQGTATPTNAPSNDKVTAVKEVVPEICSIKVENDSETSEENKPMEPREAIVRSVPSIELPDGKIYKV